MSLEMTINNRPVNGKTESGILIDAIRDMDSKIMKNANCTEKEKKFFVPDYYKKTEGEEFGCGNWLIKKKGMALLAKHLKKMCMNEDLTEEDKEDTLWCFYFIVDILADMELKGIKKIEVRFE